MNSVLKLPVCHFSYVTLVTEGALITFFPEKKMAGGAYRSRGAKWGEYCIVIEPIFFFCNGNHGFSTNLPKTVYNQSLTQTMLQIKFNQDWPAGLGDIQV